MGSTIIVDPSKLDTVSSTIDGMVSDYKNLYGTLFSEVDGIGAAWQGADNQAFVNKIKGFSDDYLKMATLMGQYSQFLKDSSKAYTGTQNNVISAAGKLASNL